MLTIAITSHNRGKYLRALLSSLETAAKDLDAQVVIVDNFSSEREVHDAISTHSSMLDEVVFRRTTLETPDWINDEYIAKNTLLSLAKHDDILFLQDDLQYIGPGAEAIARAAHRMRTLGLPCLTHTAIRRVSVNSYTNTLVDDDPKCKIWTNANQHYATTGFFLKEITDKLGPYPTSWPNDSRYWGASEDYYDKSVKQLLGQKLISGFLHVPLFAGVWNDPRGGYSFIRDNKRYGVYSSPIDDNFYYRRMTVDEFEKHMSSTSPLAFPDVVRPIGWEFARDENGDQAKYPQAKIMLEGPVEGLDNVASNDPTSVKNDAYIDDWLDS